MHYEAPTALNIHPEMYDPNYQNIIHEDKVDASLNPRKLGHTYKLNKVATFSHVLFIWFDLNLSNFRERRWIRILCSSRLKNMYLDFWCSRM